ncbi:MAG: thioester domain-containing protein [Actinomycetota bacterium]|nr:thioester domain-containing protein [Actinomycetota bacterium]
MGSRSKLGRAGVALAATTAMVTLAALPAAADAPSGIVKTQDKGLSVQMSDKAWRTASLFNLDLGNNKSLKLYCVQIHVQVSHDRTYSEVPWNSFPKKDSSFVKNNDKIKWVLTHGYPASGLSKLNKLTGADLSKQEAIAATQAAVWHYSDSLDLAVNSDPTEGDNTTDKDVVALYKYLIGKDNTGAGEETTPALKITPADATGESGKLVGPFKFETNGVLTEVAADLPEGVLLTDADGKQINSESVKNGTEVFFKVPAAAEAGNASITAKADFKKGVGRLFVVNGYETKEAQSLIVADSEITSLNASAKGDWKLGPVQTTTGTPAPTSSSEAPVPTTTVAPVPQAKSDDLADTGASILVPVLVGLGLVGAGAGALIYQRRRKSA